MNGKQIVRIVQLALTAVAALTLTGPAEAGNHPSNKIILMRPADLPELAQHAGQAMLLHDTGDGRKVLYIEQRHGARLAIFDVTDPGKIKGEVSVQLEGPGSFDFVFNLGDHAELIQFRNGQGVAVLDLHEPKTPTVKVMKGLKQGGFIKRLGDVGFIVVNQASGASSANPKDYRVVETTNPMEPNHLATVTQVRQELRNDDTGTTYLLASDGLYIIRRPDVEEEYDEIQEEQIKAN